MESVKAKEIKHLSTEYSAFYMAIKQLQNDTMDKGANPLQSLAHRIPWRARICSEKIKEKSYEVEVKCFHVYQSLQ